MPGPCSMAAAHANTTLLGAGVREHLTPGVSSAGHKSPKIQTRGSLVDKSGFSERLDAPMQAARAQFRTMQAQAQGRVAPVQGPIAQDQVPVVGDFSKKVIAGTQAQSQRVTQAVAGIASNKGINMGQLGVLMGDAQKSAMATIKMISEVKNWNTTFFTQMNA